MARQKRNAFIDAVFPIAILLGVLWAFDRPFARTLLGRVAWIVAIAAIIAGVLVAIYVIAKGAQSREGSALQGVSGKRSSESSVTPGAWSLELIRELEWKRFEMLCAGYFEAKGYHPKATRIGADGGIDITLHRKGDPTGKTFGVVQCKAWSRAPVGIKPVRELFGVKAAEEAPLAVFITTTDYTKDAKAFAEGRHLELISGAKLVELLRGLPDTASNELLAKVTEGDYKTPTCPHCDIKMALRTSQKGNNPGNQFWGCRNYPRCRQMLGLASRGNRG